MIKLDRSLEPLVGVSLMISCNLNRTASLHNLVLSTDHDVENQCVNLVPCTYSAVLTSTSKIR